MADVLEENPDLQEDWFVKCYVNGMKETIKAQLRPLRPTSLTSAYWQAKEMEQCLPVRKSYTPHFQKFSNPNNFKQTNVLPVVNKIPKALNAAQKPRVKGQCWRCGDLNWVPGHKCRQIPVLNFLAQALDQEQMQQEKQQLQMLQTQDTEEQGEGVEEQNNSQLMSISLQALGQEHNTNTPTVRVSIKGKQAIALIDSGSSTLFMDLNFAIKTSCVLQAAPEREVKVAGGGRLLSKAVAEAVFTTAKYKFHHTFRVLNLPDHELTLGCDWLEHHSPFTMDFQASTLTIHKEGREQVTLPISNSGTTVTEIPAEQLQKLLEQGSVAYMLQLDTCSANPDETKQLLPELDKILEKFTDVFAPPTELPPHRQCDHTIPLKENALPPTARPYRVPHKQKDEMESQIKELLTNKIIRTSQSPYASPAILVRKKDGSWRLCVDYRKLNALTVIFFSYSSN